MATGELKKVLSRQGRWGESSLLEACDDALAFDGVNPGDYLVVDRNSPAPMDDGLVVILEENGPTDRPLSAVPQKGGRDAIRKGKQPKRLLLRKMERFGHKVRLQPGSSPRRSPFVAAESAGIWGVVVAVMRKFEAA